MSWGISGASFPVGNHRDTRCNSQAMAESASAWSQDSESINLIIVIIFVSVALTGKGAAVGITKGCSSEMLCQRSLYCGINRIHAAGKGSTRLVSASIRDAHAPPTGSFTCLCHSGVYPKIFSSWKERKTLMNMQHYHSLWVDFVPWVLLPQAIIKADDKELPPLSLLSIPTFLMSLTGYLYFPVFFFSQQAAEAVTSEWR